MDNFDKDFLEHRKNKGPKIKDCVPYTMPGINKIPNKTIYGKEISFKTEMVDGKYQIVTRKMI